MEFNYEKFASAIREKKVSLPFMSMRSICRRTGVHHATMNRAIHVKGEVGLTQILKICSWLNKPITEFIDNGENKESTYEGRLR